MNKTIERHARIGTLALVFVSLSACAISVDTFEIDKVQIENADGTLGSDTSDIPYDTRFTVTGKARLNRDATGNGYRIEAQLWEDDGPAGDDQLSKTVDPLIDNGEREVTFTYRMRCNQLGEMSGNNEVDIDDDNVGEVREYELYLYEIDLSKSSAERIVKCIPEEEEEDDDHDSGGSSGGGDD